MIRETVVRPDPEATGRAVAEAIAEAAGSVLERSDRFSLVLSGGHTPETLFRQLATDFRAEIDWPHVHLFWTDERAVGPDDPSSNFGLARRSLIQPLGLSDAQVHRIHGERRPVARAAAEYEAELRAYWSAAGSKEPPKSTFDFVVLGVGPDGHTASLFPPMGADRPSREWVAPVAPPALPPAVERVTLTLSVLNRSEEVAFLVCGSEKQGIVQRILRGHDQGAKRLPAGRVRALGRLRWFLDAAAAGPGAVGGPSRVATA